MAWKRLTVGRRGGTMLGEAVVPSKLVEDDGVDSAVEDDAVGTVLGSTTAGLTYDAAQPHVPRQTSGCFLQAWHLFGVMERLLSALFRQG